MKNLLLLLAVFGCCQWGFSQEKVTISGYLTDAANGESLIGATVFIQETANGTVTNVYGFYSITLEPGTYNVEYRFLGYETIYKEIELLGNQRIDLELSEGGVELVEVVVTGEPEDLNVSGVQMSTQKLDIKTIQKLPAFLGEADVIKSIQTLPGVSTVGEGASGFNVRGGSVGQSLVLLDEAPVYNSSHLLGFFSVFNPDAVKDVQLIKGGIPSRYGGRIASILDVRMKEGNSKKFAAQGGIGTIFSRLAVEGPIVKDKASFIVAGRRSYADVFAKAFTDVLDDGAALNFWDLTLKTNYNINAKNRIFVSGYLGRDNFKFDAQQGFSWGSQTATVRWNHLFNDRLFANFTFFYSNYDYELAFGEDDLDKFTWNSTIKNLDFKPELTYFINPNNKLTFGGEILQYTFEPANAVAVSDGETQDISLNEKQALETSVFIGNDQKIGEKIDLQYGLRYSNFAYLGPGKYYEFAPAAEPGERRFPTEEFTAESGETIANYGTLEPRFSIKYQLDDQSSLKGSYNRTAQYIHLISNTTASNPLDVWTPSTNNIKPEIGDQVAVGYFRNFGADNDFETSAELYYRKTTGQIDYVDGADILINEFLEGDLLEGIGRAYGMELYIKKNTGKFNGYLSYTLARTELQVDGINEGEWYPTRFDQTHNFKLTMFYEPENRWSFSANFTYVSGTPTTFPTSRFAVQGYTIPLNFGNGRNNVRIPDFHRLDVAATLQGRKVKRNGQAKKNESYWVFSVYNLYGRRNPFSIYFSQVDERFAVNEPATTTANRVAIIGSAFPAISYNFKF
ncbi:MAG: TonB-dependent receptor [Bacteroidota bacterium]